MVNVIRLHFRAAIVWGWATLRRVSAAVRDRFPETPPPQQPYPFQPKVSWSLTSSESPVTLDPNDTIQAVLLENRGRFASGELVAPLAALASRGVTIVTRITETGATPAHHLVIIAPSGTLHFATNLPQTKHP